jgi:hypothetical protein
MADGFNVSEIVKRTVQANAKLYKGWVDLSLDYWRGIAEIFGGSQSVTSPIAELDLGLGTGALVLEGEDAATARGAFLVTNDLERAVSCELVASPFVDADGVTVRAAPTFDPAKLDLAPGEQHVVRVAIPIDAALAAGVGYTGEIAIKGMDGFSVPVVLRRRHRVDDASVDSPPPNRAPTANVPSVQMATREQASRASAATSASPGKRIARQKK